jgi:hypothetical protein
MRKLKDNAAGSFDFAQDDRALRFGVPRFARLKVVLLLSQQQILWFYRGRRRQLHPYAAGCTSTGVPTLT